MDYSLNENAASMKLVTIIKIIGVITVLSGLVQMVVPAFVLKTIGAEINPTSEHFFRIVGMFMALFGGLQWQITSKSVVEPIPLFWCGMQKLGASLAVPLGVAMGIFSVMALAVASFDFASSILIFICWNRIKKNN